MGSIFNTKPPTTKHSVIVLWCLCEKRLYKARRRCSFPFFMAYSHGCDAQRALENTEPPQLVEISSVVATSSALVPVHTENISRNAQKQAGETWRGWRSYNNG